MPVGKTYQAWRARLFGQLLTIYCGTPTPNPDPRDLLTECWEQMSDDVREQPFVVEFCTLFGLPPPGHLIHERYALETVIGIGGMGVVYRAMHPELGRVALKLMRPDCPLRERFLQEARHTVRLEDRRFLIVKDAGVDEATNLPFFTMDEVEGGKSLTDLIDHKSRFDDRVLTTLRRLLNLTGPDHRHPWYEFLFGKFRKSDRHFTGPGDRLLAAVVMSVADAVEMLHQHGVVHCDLKPGNILISRKHLPIVGDLGLSRQLNADGRTAPESFTGTAPYSSPEQVTGKEGLRRQSDVYQLGAILYRGLVGHAPFKRLPGEQEHALRARIQEATEEMDPPTRLGLDVSKDLKAICMKALRRNWRQRYESAGAMGADLQRFLNGEPVRAARCFSQRKLLHTCLHSAWTYLLALALSAATLGWWAYWLNHEEVDGCIASKNRYRALDVVAPPNLEVLPIRDPRNMARLLGTLSSPAGDQGLLAASLLAPGILDGWPSPDYSHVKIDSSSVYFDLSRWTLIPQDMTPATADRSQGEVGLYTRVTELTQTRSALATSKVYFQFRTEGFDVDLKCTSHPYKVRGSARREQLGGGTPPVLIREIEVDLAGVPQTQKTRIIVQGTIWNGFQYNSRGKQWAAFLAPDKLLDGEVAVKFKTGMKPKEPPKLLFFEKGSESQNDTQGTPDFHNSRDKDWWLWRPRDIRANHVYQMEWDWKPTQSR